MKTLIITLASVFVVCVAASSVPDAVRGKEAFEKRDFASRTLANVAEFRALRLAASCCAG